MANPFQSTPGYGVPYGSSPYYPHYQQYGTQQSAPSPSPYSPHSVPPMNGYQPSPNANMARFDANAPATPHQRFPFPPAPFPPPDMLKQFSASNVPLPPPPQFPPVPIPNLGLHQYPHNLPHTNTPPFHQPSNFAPSEDPNAYDPRYPQHTIPPRQVEIPAFGHSDRQPRHPERNDVHEDDSPSSRTISHEGQAQDHALNHHNMNNHSNFDGKFSMEPSEYLLMPLQGAVFSSQNGTTAPNLDHASSQTAQAAHDGLVQANIPPPQESSLSQPMPLKPPYIPPREQETSTHVQSSLNSQYRPGGNVKAFQRNYENKTPIELRQLAKGALLSLVPHNIHYSELLKEGINAQLLAKLYEELGIKVPAVHTPTQVEQPVPALVAQPPETQANVIAHSTASLNTSTTSLPGISSNPQASLTIDRPPPAISPGLERKDRIAQLLAAKAGRPSLVRSISDSVASAGPPDAPLAASQTESSAAVGPRDVHYEAFANVEHTLSKTRSATQTDLTKQQVEELRANTEIKTQAERRTTDGGALLSPLSASIPGLFMTSDNPTQVGATKDAFASRIASDGARSVSVSQKRRRSCDAGSGNVEPTSKRQAITVDDDGDEVMVPQSSSREDVSDDEIMGVDETINSGVQRRQPGASITSASTPNGAPLQRSQSAAEVPGLTPQTQAPISRTLRSGFPSQTRPFGGSPVTGLTAAQITERAEQLKARFLKQRAERQKALQDGLPNLDAEVLKTRALLAEKQNELPGLDEQIQAANAELSQAEQQKQSVVEEIARLEKHLQEGIYGQVQYKDELQNLGTDQNGTDTATASRVALGLPSLENADEVAQQIGRASVQAPTEAEPESSTLNSRAQPDIVAFQSSLAPEAAVSALNGGNQENTRARYLDTETAPQGAVDSVEADYYHDPHAVKENEEEVGIIDQEYEDEAMVNGSTYSPTGQIQQSFSEIPEKDVEIEDAEESDGSASMSDSGSDTEEEGEYEPADPDTTYPMEIEDNASDEYDPEEAPLDAVAPASQLDDLDDYEPGELLTSPEDGSAQTHDETEISNAQEPAQDQNGSRPIISNSTPLLVEEAEPGIRALNAQPSPAPPAANASAIVRPLSNEGTAQASGFAPYQSPLSNFKSFRYNQQFNEAAREGFRSLTYSNAIDPKTPLCQTELSGGVCQNASCQEQHFKHLELTDDQILVQMSSPQAINDKETRDRFTNGLKELIAELRSRNVKEFENVAVALSDYRRRFFAEAEVG